MRGRVLQVNVSDGGVPKRPVPRARVGRLGIEGDAVRHPGIHGGPDRAVCLYAIERVRGLQAEGHPVEAGSLGENLTLEGVDFADLRPGDRLRVGAHAVLEVVSYTTPCKTIAGSFRDGDSTRVHQKQHAGWSRVYARVLVEGDVGPGDAVERAARQATL